MKKLFLLLIFPLCAHAYFTLPDVKNPNIRHRYDINKETLICNQSDYLGEELELLKSCQDSKSFYEQLKKENISMRELFDEIQPNPWTIIRRYYSKDKIECLQAQKSESELEECRYIKNFFDSLPKETKDSFVKEVSSEINPLELLPLKDPQCGVGNSECYEQKKKISKMSFKERITHNARARNLRMIFLGANSIAVDCR